MENQANKQNSPQGEGKTREVEKNASGANLGALTGMPGEGLAKAEDYATLARKQRIQRARIRIRKQVDELIAKELELANGEYGQFNSQHEGYAVLLEELEEVDEALGFLKMNTDYLWRLIRSDRRTVEQIRATKHYAVSLIDEAIQVGAMLEKLLALVEKKGE